MIVANLATYPPRREGLHQAVAALAPQLDRLNVILNEYDAELPELAGFANVRQILPEHDTKDAGKFYPDGATEAEFVFMVDDDLVFPDDFVASTVAKMRKLGPGHIGGYHASLYEKPEPSLRLSRLKKWLRYSDRRIADYRRVFTFYLEQASGVVVDQIATNAAIMAGSDFPPYDYMKDSQKFVDVRLAKWCFEHDITPVVLPREAGWLAPLRFDESIYEDFTKTNPPHVAAEILTYAFKVPARGTEPAALSRMSKG
jgi:hypothetical protein